MSDCRSELPRPQTSVQKLLRRTFRAAAAVELQSASGDIKVGIRQGSNVWVDARAMSGDLSSELELGDDARGDDAPLVELRATSMSGDVRVARAPAATNLIH